MNDTATPQTEAANTWLSLQSFSNLTRAQYSELFAAIEREAAQLDVDRLAKALHGTRSICMRPAELCRFDPTGFHHDWAEAIAAEYERTAALVPA